MDKNLNSRLSLFVLMVVVMVSGGPMAAAQTENNWPMAAHDAKRSGWSPEQISTSGLNFSWYRPIEPYMKPDHQLIAAEGKIFASTARGLYALNADSGNVDWVFPTELPLGNSPTYSNGVLFVGGMDHQLYAISAANGQKLASFEASAGFMTNPLIVSDLIIVPNRNGTVYALRYNSSNRTFSQAWTFKTNGPIVYSAAASGNTVYVASNDMYAYALNLSNGSKIWQSAKLPGAGFFAWWPVIWGNTVVLSASPAYRTLTSPGPAVDIKELERIDIFGNMNSNPNALPVSNRMIDVTAALRHFEDKPYRRTTLFLNQSNGQELMVDTNNNGKNEYSPFLWFGTKTGSRLPPIVSPDGRIYQSMLTGPHGEYMSRGKIVGWSLNDLGHVYAPTSVDYASDEPVGYTGSGNTIYYALMGDRSAGAFDISSGSNKNFWLYDLDRTDGNAGKLPGYNVMYWGSGWESNLGMVYGTVNGVYGVHGHQNSFIPYRGKIYIHRSNGIISMAAGASPRKLDLAAKPSTTNIPVSYSVDGLKSLLSAEVQKILSAGHLRSGYDLSGNGDRVMNHETVADRFMDAFHWPSNTLYTLARAMPHLSSSMQTSVRSYLNQEYSQYPPGQINHIGFASGTAREDFTLPPEPAGGISGFGTSGGSNFYGWNFNPYSFYELWKYAQVMGNSKTVFDATRNSMGSVPSDSTLTERPYVLNAWISGLWGYLELQKNAGYSEDSGRRSTLNRLIDLRVSTFNKDSPYQDQGTNNERQLALSRNFMFIAPEVAASLYSRMGSKIDQAIAEYSWVAPYWFVSRMDVTYAEGGFSPNFDTYALFSMKAYAQKRPREELVKYLDVPAFPRGDLYYMQKLVGAIEAGGSGGNTPIPTPTGTSKPGDANGDGRVDGVDYATWLRNYGLNVTGSTYGDFNNNGRVDGADYVVWLNNYDG